jgi:N6-L-threonylcarbamoyladenine synthase
MTASSLDLKAGQAVDRAGVMLGMPFPAGPELDKLACLSDRSFKIKPYMSNGSCSFSGVENKCRQMLEKGESKQDIAKYCIDYICTAVRLMTEAVIAQKGELPVIYAGGVMSNSIIQKTISKDFDSYFAPPCYSSDNAAGTAYLGYIRETRKW